MDFAILLILGFWQIIQNIAGAIYYRRHRPVHTYMSDYGVMVCFCNNVNGVKSFGQLVFVNSCNYRRSATASLKRSCVARGLSLSRLSRYAGPLYYPALGVRRLLEKRRETGQR